MTMRNRQIQFIVTARNAAAQVLQGAGRQIRQLGERATRTARNLRNTGDATRRAGDAAGRASRNWGNFGERLSRASRAVAILQGPLGGIAARVDRLRSLIANTNVVFAAFAVSVTALGFAVVRSIGNIAKYESQLLTIEGQIRATGSAAGLTTPELVAMAERVGDMTLASRSGARELAGQLLAFTNITGAQVERTMFLAADVAQVTGRDIQSVGSMLGRALDNPTEGVTRLTRLGITLNENTRDYIRTLQEQGRTVEAQNVLFRELESRFKSTGQAAAQGLAGELDTIGEILGDLGPKFTIFSGGRAAMNDFATGVRKALQMVERNLEKIAYWFNRAKDALIGFLAAAAGFTVVRTLAVALISLPAILAAVTAAFRRLTIAMAANPFGAIAVAISTVVGALYSFRDAQFEVMGRTVSIGGIVGEVWEQATTRVGEAVNWMQDKFVSAGGLTGAISTLNERFAGIPEAFGSAIMRIWPYIRGLINLFIGLQRSTLTVFMGMARGIYTLMSELWESVGGGFESLGEMIAGAVTLDRARIDAARASLEAAVRPDFSRTAQIARDTADSLGRNFTTNYVGIVTDQITGLFGEDGWVDRTLDAAARRTATRAEELRRRTSFTPDAMVVPFAGLDDEDGSTSEDQVQAQLNALASALQRMTGQYAPAIARANELRAAHDLLTQATTLASRGGERFTQVLAAAGLTTEQFEQLLGNVRTGINATGTALGEVQAGVQSFVNRTQDGMSVLQKGTESVLDGMSSALDEFTRTGKLNFRNMVSSMIADLMRLQAQRAFTSVVSNFMPGIGSMFGVGHTGGLAGRSVQGRRMVDPGVFRGAQKYHTGGLAGSGVRRGEVPLIAKKNEALMPTARMSDGSFGVKAMVPDGGGGARNIYITNAPVIHMHANENGSFDAKSAHAASKAVQESIRKVVQETLADEMRRGGMMGGDMRRGGI
jgi:hypothetical protein